MSIGFFLKFLIKQSGENLFLPYYHTVSDKELPHIKQLYPVKSVKQFEQELDYLLKHFKPIGLSELFSVQNRESYLSKPSFFLSFDDGFRQCYEVIAPILLRKGIPATFFINSAFFDNKELMYRNKLSYLASQNIIQQPDFEKYDYANRLEIDKLAEDNGIDFNSFLEKEQPYMTLAQIKELAQKGFTIGAHSHSHPYYKNISIEEQLAQTRQSLAFVKQHFNPSITAFAFPFDDVGVSASFFNKMKEEVDLFFTTGGIKQDELQSVYRRVDMENQQNLPAHLLELYGKFLLKQTIGYRAVHKRQ